MSTPNHCASTNTDRQVRTLEAQLARLEAERAQDRELVAAASELVAADRAVDVMVEQSWRGTATGTVAKRLAVVERLRRAQKRLGELRGLVD